MKTKNLFYPEYMEKHKPKVPKCICENTFKNFIGIVSPSLYWIVLSGGKGDKAKKDLDFYNKKMIRYLCYKRKLGKEQWEILYRDYRRNKMGNR